MEALRFRVREQIKNLQLTIQNYPFSFEKAKDIQREALSSLKRNGYYIIPNYFPKTDCTYAIKKIDELLRDNQIKIWKNSTDSDQRIFGINNLDIIFEKFYSDKNIFQIIQYYEKSLRSAGFTMGSRLTYIEGNKGSGEGWHRDRIDWRQTKSILYLNDVDESRGPFQYILNSHHPKSVISDNRKYNTSLTNTRISENKIDELIRNEPDRLKEICGEAGTLILVDTRGIHRGKPIQVGKTRYSMTNYLWFDTEIPLHIKEFVNG